MSRDLDANLEPIESIDQLRQPFADGCKGDGPRGIGTEHEKFGYDAETLQPLPWDGPRGISAHLETLASDHGWTPIVDDTGRAMALEREGAHITLEPGGQLELSGGVTRTVHETRDELARHVRETADVGDTLGQRWAFFGLRPTGTKDDVPWMPRSRHAIMRRYLGGQGRLAHWMMKMTCTVQANYDYRTEADALDMLRVGGRLSPLVTALFANSPIVEGERSAFASWRMHVWEHTDDDRCGTPAFYLDPDATFDDVVQWLLDVPMFFLLRDGRYIDVAGASFRDFMANGLDGHTATMGDWELHMSTVFPDVRIKKYIETRTADGGPPWAILALPALWKGLFYDDDARAAAARLVATTDPAALKAFAFDVARRGLDAEWQGTSARDLATELVRIAGDSLDGLAVGHETERGYLAPLLDDAGIARSPADRFAADWDATGGDIGAMLDRYSATALADAMFEVP